MQTPEHFTLKQVADSIRKTIAERYARTYWVTAEMHKLNATRKGHCYPELVQKEDGQIVVEMRGTIWKQQFERIQQRFSNIVKEPLRDGMELLFQVKITYHPLYNIGLEIIDIDPNYTLGALQRERQETLERLNKEGILNANQDVEMTLFPKRLAILSQADSKGYSDFVTLLNGHPKRYHFDTFLFEATLQGDAAIRSIQDQLKRIQKVQHHFDAVVIIRGGGGEIGMHCYNNYELAKAIATFPLPVLTGIGHSTNLTVCEMIAYRNGITPSDMAYFLLSIAEELDAPLDQFTLQLPAFCAKLFTQTKHQFKQSVVHFQQEVRNALQEAKFTFNRQTHLFELTTKQGLQQVKEELNTNRNKLRLTSESLLERNQLTVKQSVSYLHIHTKNQVEKQTISLQQQEMNLLKTLPGYFIQQQNALTQHERTVQLMDPLHLLNRGYAIVQNEKGVLSANNQAQKGDTLQIQTAQQQLAATIIETKTTKR